MNVRPLSVGSMIPLVIIGLFLLVGTAVRAQTAAELCTGSDATDQETITACTQWIRSRTLTDKELATAYNNRGVAYANTGQDNLALPDYTQALHFNPDGQRAYVNRGRVYFRKGLYDIAIADYTEALRIAPNYLDAYTNRGIAYKEKGQMDLANDDFGKALVINSNSQSESSEPYYNRAFGEYLTGRPDVAVLHYGMALRVDPASNDTYASRAFAFIDMDRFSDAERDFASAVKLAPTWAEGVFWLHIARARAGDNDASEFVTNAGAVDSTKWPAPLVNFFLGIL